MNPQDQGSDALKQQQQLWMQSFLAANQATSNMNMNNPNGGNCNKNLPTSQADTSNEPRHPGARTHASSNHFGNTPGVGNVGTSSVPTQGNTTVRFNSQVAGTGLPGGGQMNPAAWLGGGAAQIQTVAAPQQNTQAALFHQLQNQLQAAQLQNRAQQQQNPIQQPQFQQAAQLAALQSLLQSIAGGAQQQQQTPASISNTFLQQFQGIQGMNNPSNGNQSSLNSSQHQMGQPVTNGGATANANLPNTGNHRTSSVAGDGRNSAASKQNVALWNNNSLVHSGAPPSSDTKMGAAQNTFSKETAKTEGVPATKESSGKSSLPPLSTPVAFSPPTTSGAALAASSQDSVRVSNSGPILVPCRSRTAPPGHNIKTGYLLIPDDASHGMDLLCSHNQCRNEGVKFLYCAVCQLPVAKRNFRKRHSHLDVLLNQVSASSHPQLQVKSSTSKFAQGVLVAPKPKVKESSQGRSKSDSAPLAPREQKQQKSLEGASQKISEKERESKKAAVSKDDEQVTKNPSFGCGKAKESQTKGSAVPSHVSKSTPNGHSVSFSGSCSEPPSSLSNGDSNSNQSDLTTQATAAGMKPPPALKNGNAGKIKSQGKALGSRKNKASKTMAEVLDTYNKTNNTKLKSKRKSSKKLESSSNKQMRTAKEGPDKPLSKSTNETENLGTTTKISNDSSAAPPFPDSKGNSSEEFKKSGAEELKNMRRLLRTGNNDATAATASSSESSGAAVARQNQAAAEQAINVDAATTRMWEALLHERPSSNSVNDFRKWLLRCLSVSARFEGNRQHLSDSINAKAANRDNSVHSCSARCSSVSSLSSETLQDKGSIASSSDVAVMIRDGVNMAERSSDSDGPLENLGEKSHRSKKRFQQEPHILELPDDFHIDTPAPSGTDGGSGSNSSKMENKINDTAAVVESFSGGDMLEPHGNLVPMVEEAQRKKHPKKRKRKHEGKDSGSTRSNRSNLMLEDVTQAVGV